MFCKEDLKKNKKAAEEISEEDLGKVTGGVARLNGDDPFNSVDSNKLHGILRNIKDGKIEKNDDKKNPNSCMD